jgi:dipeptidyl aminopeptidase/acylaminoacyl peptidase
MHIIIKFSFKINYLNLGTNVNMMKKNLLLLLLVNCSIFNFAQKSNIKYWSPEQALKMKNINGFAISPDGKKIVYGIREAIMTDDKSEYVTQLFICTVDGTNTLQLTKGDKNNIQPSWNSDNKHIAFISGRDGKNNLYVLNIEGGEAEKITDVKTSITNFSWCPYNNQIAYLMLDAPLDIEEKNKKGKNDWSYMDDNNKQNRLYIINTNQKDSTGKYVAKLLTKENYYVTSFSWHPTNENIVFSHCTTGKAGDVLTNGDVEILNYITGKIEPIASTKAVENSAVYSHNGKWIAFSCNDDPTLLNGTIHTKIIPSTGGIPKTLALTPDEQSTIVGWTDIDNAVLVSSLNKTLNSLYKLNISDNSIEELTKNTKDYMQSFTLNAHAKFIAFTLQNLNTPPELYFSPLAIFAPKKISNLHYAIAKNPTPTSEIIQWKTKDGKVIEAVITYPIGYEKGKKYAMLLNVHGGPAGVFNQAFITSNQSSYPVAAFAEMGFIILRPNPRGSSGYGATFRLANQKDWGGEDYFDLMQGVDELIKKGIADENKLGVMGWSYGGYMSSWIVGHTNRFKAASIGAPVIDLTAQNLTDDVPDVLKSYMKAEPWQDAETYRKLSPISYVQNVTTPVLLQHGEADIRVPISQSIMFYNALKRKGNIAKLLTLPRQPHGPNEPKMNLKVMQTNIDWFDTYLMK